MFTLRFGRFFIICCLLWSLCRWHRRQFLIIFLILYLALIGQKRRQIFARTVCPLAWNKRWCSYNNIKHVTWFFAGSIMGNFWLNKILAFSSRPPTRKIFFSSRSGLSSIKCLSIVTFSSPFWSLYIRVLKISNYDHSLFAGYFTIIDESVIY